MATTVRSQELLTRPSPVKLWLSHWSGAVEAIDDNPSRVLFAVCILYLFLVLPLAVIKLLWADEFITYYIAKLNGVSAIWGALNRGADPNPPVSHVLVMWSMRLFGDSELAVRLPAILACLMGVVCLYLFLRHRVPVVYAATGACFFMSTAAFNYAYESRSYALVLGLSMLSLLMWHESIEGKRPILSTIMLAVALGLGIASNYFAVLAFFPIAAGELVRDVQRRRVEWRVWYALAVGAVPFFFFLPLINHAIAQFGPHAWNRTTADVIPDSYTEMVEVVIVPAIVILGMAGIHMLYERKTFGKTITPPVLPRHELVAVFFLMIYPVIGYVLAVVRAGMISPRFVLPVAYGFSIATVVACYRMFARWKFVGGIVLLFFLSWAIARDGFCAYDYFCQRTALFRVRDTIPPSNTIVVADSLLVQPLYHYSPPDVAARMVFPLDFHWIRHYKGEDSLEQNYWAGRDIFPVPMVSLVRLKETTPSYVIVAPGRNWLLQKLEEDGRPARLLPIWNDSKDIAGFTPLSHAETFFFEVGRALPRDEEYASSTGRNSLSNWNREHRSHGGSQSRGMQQ